jgi:hypothetical protein
LIVQRTGFRGIKPQLSAFFASPPSDQNTKILCSFLRIHNNEVNKLEEIAEPFSFPQLLRIALSRKKTKEFSWKLILIVQERLRNRSQPVSSMKINIWENWNESRRNIVAAGGLFFSISTRSDPIERGNFS